MTISVPSGKCYEAHPWAGRRKQGGNDEGAWVLLEAVEAAAEPPSAVESVEAEPAVV